MGPTRPDGPYAWFLTNSRQEFEFLGFDFDAGRFGRAAVQRDVAELRERLDAADLRYVECASGPGGGAHVWVPVEPTAAAVVRQLAYAAGRLLPTLDKSPLTNPATGCLRPPGAPHRAGGISTPMHEGVPITPQAVDAMLSVPNDGDALARLAIALEAGEADPAQIEAERVRTVELTPDGPKLAGRYRPCDVAGLVATAPAAGQGHAVLMRILVRLALARWSRGQAVDLVEAHLSAPGLVHVRRQDGAAGARARDAAARRRLLERQWDRAVAYAATLRRDNPDPGPTGEDGGWQDAEADWVRRVAAVVEVVDGVEHAIEAATATGRWSRQSGPSDRKTLEYVLELALDAVSEEIELDCRRLALATGMGKSTAARSLHRLCLDEWLVLVTPGEGQRSHRYRLMPRPAPDGTVGPTISTAVTFVTQAPSGGGGTQANPRPRAEVRPALALRKQRLAALRQRREIWAHDLFTHPNTGHQQPGLGRHVGATVAAALHTGLYKVDQISEITGYHPATTRRHLTLLRRHHLTPGRTPQAAERLHARLDRAARRIGAHGTHERRHRTYAIERAAWAWWLAEHAWMRTRGKPRKGQPLIPGQRQLILAGAPAHANRQRYPRDRRGRADHRAARAHLTATHAENVA
ncbi:hypothetical protein [Nonomuraea typhae]|uniref:hypothetical protein n=1 Tax=Nonomuraea typhae TaxID=2603600 RepID=UPI0012F9F5F8|nr:hypothetical protein [Nonomuraea typhae]